MTDRSDALYLGLDLGGTDIKATVSNDRGEILVPASGEGAQPGGRGARCGRSSSWRWPARWRCGRLGAGWEQVACVGLDTPGPATVDGVIGLSPNLRHPDWNGFAIRAAVEARRAPAGHLRQRRQRRRLLGVPPPVRRRRQQDPGGRHPGHRPGRRPRLGRRGAGRRPRLRRRVRPHPPAHPRAGHRRPGPPLRLRPAGLRRGVRQRVGARPLPAPGPGPSPSTAAHPLQADPRRGPPPRPAPARPGPAGRCAGPGAVRPPGRRPGSAVRPAGQRLRPRRLRHRRRHHRELAGLPRPLPRPRARHLPPGRLPPGRRRSPHRMGRRPGPGRLPRRRPAGPPLGRQGRGTRRVLGGARRGRQEQPVRDSSHESGWLHGVRRVAGRRPGPGSPRRRPRGAGEPPAGDAGACNRRRHPGRGRCLLAGGDGPQPAGRAGTGRRRRPLGDLSVAGPRGHTPGRHGRRGPHDEHVQVGDAPAARHGGLVQDRARAEGGALRLQESGRTAAPSASTP